MSASSDRDYAPSDADAPCLKCKRYYVGVDRTNEAAHGVYSNARGVLGNAFAHACAIRIEAKITCDDRLRRLTIRAALIPTRAAYGKRRSRFGRLLRKAQERREESR